MSTTADAEVPLPPVRMRFMNGDKDDAQFVATGRALADRLRAHGLRDEHAVLDVGSGYGRLAVGLLTTGFPGRYLGIDILKRPVAWCQRSLSPYTEGRFRFRHLDVRNGRYNPDGVVAASDLRFPAQRASHDFVAVFSVFTHMYEADILRYLSEIRRVLKPGGRAVTTWFLFDEARLSAILSAETSALPMVNEINAVTRFYDSRDPLWAICYDERHVLTMVAAAGLEVVETVHGAWCGTQSTTGQDLLVLTRAHRESSPPHPVHRWARRVVRRLPSLRRPRTAD